MHLRRLFPLAFPFLVTHLFLLAPQSFKSAKLCGSLSRLAITTRFLHFIAALAESKSAFVDMRFKFQSLRIMPGPIRALSMEEEAAFHYAVSMATTLLCSDAVSVLRTTMQIILPIHADPCRSFFQSMPCGPWF